MKNKTKVLITIEGGNISSINSNDNIEVIVVDYDNPENGDDLVYKYPVDKKKFISGKAYNLLNNAITKLEDEAYHELKRLKF